jgi:putative nucleotidyltransferase with HDIG domain
MAELMKREEALAFMESQVTNRNLRKHMLAAEAIMRALAHRLGESEELWALAGLLHDVDYDTTAKDASRHALVSAEILEQKGLPAELVHAVKAHAEKAPLESRLDKALYACDPLTGFLVSCALIRPEKKLNAVDVQFVKNRMAEKSFSRAVDRDQIKICEQFGVPLDEFIQIALDAMKAASSDLGL